MKQNRIRLTESQLHKVIKESVKKVLNEEGTFTLEPPKVRDSSLAKQIRDRHSQAFQVASEAEDLKDKIQDLMTNVYKGNTMYEYMCELAFNAMEDVVRHLHGLFHGGY